MAASKRSLWVLLLLVWRHEGNIRKLLAGTESKLGHAAAAAPVTSNKPAHRHGHKKGHP